MAPHDDLHERADALRLLVDTVTDYAIFLLDPNGNVATWNAGAQHLKGYTADEIIGRNFCVFYPPESGRLCEELLATAAAVGRVESEGWRVRKDGTRLWANVVITALRDPTGTLIGFGKVTRDLTERRVAEAQYRQLVDSIHDYAIFRLDLEGLVASWNTGAERIKGYQAHEIIGTHFSRFYPPADVAAGKCELELEGAARTGHYEDEGWRVRKDGSQFWANVVISAIRDESGELVGYSKITRDLTERIRSEDDRAARLAAEQANQTKDEFLAMLGHELRNPLAPILSALQILELRGDGMRELQIIDRQVRQMMRLVDDLLDISRVNQGKVELQLDTIDLRDAVAKAIESAQPMFDRKQQRFALVAPSQPLPVRGDEARLVQVIANLLGNASKYTPETGAVSLSIHADDHQVELAVRDTGRGIDPALLPSVFDLFVQGHQDVDRREGGLGVGLALVRSLIQMHGGTVTAESAGLGHGSTFTVRLPLVAPEAARPQPAPLRRSVVAGPERRRVLVVDDNEDARILLADLLTSIGHEVHGAGDGPSALAVAERVPIDVAILDIGLPGMDGYTLATAIRALPAGPMIRIVALSGYGRHAHGDGAFDVHLVKPVEVQRILAEVTAADRAR